MTGPAATAADVPLVRGAVCVITDPTRNMLVLQRKDAGYPVAAYRGALACFGGQAEPGETPAQTIHRELAEEIADVPLRDAVLSALTTVTDVTTRHGHHVWLYLAVLADLPWQAARIDHLPPHLVCAEGELVVLDRADVAGQPFAWDNATLLHAGLGAATGHAP